MTGSGCQVVRRLARDQWVRWHGTPRITVMAESHRAREIWNAWLVAVSTSGVLVEGSDLSETIGRALRHAAADPREPVAVMVDGDALASWRHGRADRSAAMVDEGWLDVAAVDVALPAAHAEPVAPLTPSAPCVVRVAAPRLPFDARSAAEAVLYDALQATPSTAGRFQLNASLSVRFGSRAAEIDLLSRADGIAVEVDGIHHFADPDRYRRDRRKDLLLQQQGFIVVRVLAEDVLRDPRDAVSFVVTAQATRGQVRP